jgi:hypothetical protein
MAKQSVEDKKKRLEDGRCPVHGLVMYQVSGPYYIVETPPPLGVMMDEHDILESMTKQFAGVRVMCTRKDCGITAMETEAFGPATLTPEWEYLLDESKVG